MGKIRGDFAAEGWACGVLCARQIVPTDRLEFDLAGRYAFKVSIVGLSVVSTALSPWEE